MSRAYIPDFCIPSGHIKMDQPSWPLILVTGIPAIVTAGLGWLGGKRQSRDTREQALWNQSQKLRDDLMQEIGRLNGINAEQEKRFSALEEKNDLEQKVRHDLRNQLQAKVMELELAKRTIEILEHSKSTLEATVVSLTATAKNAPQILLPEGSKAVSTSTSQTETHLERE